MKVGLSLIGAATTAVVAATMLSCQTYDFEPVEPLAIAQTTVTRKIASKQSKPNMMLLVDKSASMLLAAGSGTRLSEMKQAMAQFLTNYGTTARMGLAVFPYTDVSDSCGTACVPGRIVQEVVTSNDVSADLQSAADQINATIQAINEPGGLPAKGGTPTAATLTALSANAGLLDQSRENFVLLLTDGLPNCNTSLDGATCTCTEASNNCALGVNCNCLDQDGVLTVLDSLAAKKIKTIVVGFGTDTANAVPVLNAMAERGQFPRKCTVASDCGGTDTCDNGLCSTRFYQAANAQELAAALAKIGDLMVTDPCLIKLTSAPSDPQFLAVYIDGQKVEAGADTWNFDSSALVVNFTGQLCTTIMNSTSADPVNVEVRVVEAL